jgi:hypothetical protein
MLPGRGRRFPREPANPRSPVRKGLGVTGRTVSEPRVGMPRCPVSETDEKYLLRERANEVKAMVERGEGSQEELRAYRCGSLNA